MTGSYRAAHQGACQAAGALARKLGCRIPANCRARARALERERRRAQAAVEFALAFTVMGLLLAGGIDLARAFYYDAMLTTAAAEGVRAAVAGAPDSDSTPGAITVSSVATKSAPSGIISANNVSVTPAQSGRNAEGVVTTVAVSFNFTPITPFIAGIIGQSLTITRKAAERIRRPCQLASSTATRIDPCP
jgi:Flp pilus assembly protein TadG